MRRLKNFIIDRAVDASASAIYWVCEDGEVGVQLGMSSLRDDKARKPMNEADREFDCIERFAKKHARQAGGRYRKNFGWYWETEKEAREFAYRLEVEMKAAKSTRPLLAWEKQALAAGWTPPKGWKL